MSIHQFADYHPDGNLLYMKSGSVEENPSDVLNMESLNAFEVLQIENDADLIVELIDLYVSELKPRLTEIRHTAGANEWALLRRAAHNLKGSSASLGIRRVAATCAEIERMDGDDLTSQAAEIIQRLAEEVAAARAALAAVRQGRLG
jgi:HPt (histidine-containing phosphotransfer) domain-containing protein